MEESSSDTIHRLDKTDYNISEAGSVKIVFCQSNSDSEMDQLYQITTG
jgi:hypothetical protein